MGKIQKLNILLCSILIVSCNKNAESLKCTNTEDAFYDPPIENYLGNSLNSFKVKKSTNLSFRLDKNFCYRDSCSYYIFSLSQFGVHNDSMMSLRYYSRVKRWNVDDIVINCDFVKNFETKDNKSSGYFKFFRDGACPIFVKNQTDSCSYQRAILHVDSTIYFERVF